MIGASKILTVSYGTFSCTLEGFDDSFGTMKAIAEYFRDLAEKDRYFGAEPPVPDAAMLAHIAQAEIHHPVEAEVDGHDVVLRRAAAADNEITAPTSEAQDASVEPAIIQEPVAQEPISPPVDTPPLETVNLDELDEDSVAAKLKRIRAVVAQSENNGASDFSEDQHASEMTPTQPILGEISPENDPEETVKPALDSDDKALLAAFDALEEDASNGETAPKEPPAPADSPSAETTHVADVETAVKQTEPMVDTPQAEKPVAPVKPVRPRIVKMKKDDYEAAKQAGTLEEALQKASEAPAAAPVKPAIGATSLSPEDEAELLNELIDLEQDMKAEPAPAASKSILEESNAQDEAAVARIMEETNAQMNEPEGSRRRSAISHLKAAVAATVADRKLNPFTDKDSKDDAEPYRSDLAEVVRPSRPKARGNARTERTTPLVLVSEQRIDDDETVQPVAPRRVQAAEAMKSDPTPKKMGFSAFAKETGVSGMVDILEAAAAYAKYSEGRPHIGRPYLMNMAVDFIGKDGFSREEGLRAFGQLLRQDKIIKVKRGQFAIAETTRFKPMSRAAVG